MKNLLCLLIVLSVFKDIALTQSTCVFIVERLSQSALNVRFQNFPNCKVLDGKIELLSDVVDLSPLSQFEFISEIKLDNCVNLKTLHGLHNLKELPKLEIFGTNNLTDFSALPGDLKLEHLILRSYVKTNEFGELPELFRKVPKLELHSTAFKNIDGIVLDNNSKERLILSGNNELENIDVLSDLQRVTDKIVINKNRKLNSVEPLSGLKFVEEIEVSENYSLRDLPNFENLDTVGVFYMKGLIVDWNDLEPVIWPENTPTIPNVKEIKTLRLEFLSGNDTLSGYNHIRKLRNLYIRTSRYKVVDILNNLDSITGILQFSNNAVLTEIKGFVNLVYGSPVIYSNQYLKKINTFYKLKSAGRVSITENHLALDSINNFINLKFVTGTIFLRLNQKLVYFEFPELETAKDIILHGNRELLNFDFPVLYDGGGIRINFNTKLTSIGGFRNVDWTTMTDGLLIRNTSLTDCVYPFYCDYLKHHTPNVFNNGTGCSSREEILERCLALSTDDEVQALGEIKIYPNPVIGPLHIWSEILPGSEIRIIDSRGALVQQYNANDNSVTLDLSSLSAGMYFIWCQSKSGVDIKRIVKL